MRKPAGPLAADRMRARAVSGALGAVALGFVFVISGPPPAPEPKPKEQPEEQQGAQPTAFAQGEAVAAPAPVPLPLPNPRTAVPQPETAPRVETGEASWYDFSRQKTANGEIMDAERLTAAHPSLPFGTEVEIENVENGRAVVVRINDRGPYAGGRIIDVSKKAAEALDMIEDGVATVTVRLASAVTAVRAGSLE